MEYGVTHRSLSEQESLFELLSLKHRDNVLLGFQDFAEDCYEDTPRLRPALLGLGLVERTVNASRKERIDSALVFLRMSASTFRRAELEGCEELSFELFNEYTSKPITQQHDDYQSFTDGVSLGDIYRKLDLLVSEQSDLRDQIAILREAANSSLALSLDVKQATSSLKEIRKEHERSVSSIITLKGKVDELARFLKTALRTDRTNQSKHETPAQPSADTRRR